MNNKKIIIGLTGEIASGKDTVVDYLIKKYQAQPHKFSTSLRDVLTRLHLDISRQNMQKLSKSLREQFGQNLLSQVMAQDVKNDVNNLIIINGIRRFTDIEFLKKIPEFKLIHVAADMQTRYERLVQRSENSDDATKTFAQFKIDATAETEIKIKEVAQTADFTIDNNGSMDDLSNNIEKIIQQLV